MKKWLFILLSVLLTTSCQQEQRSRKQTIAVTIEPLRWFTTRIVGDRYEVMTLVPAGSSPETYEPTPRQLVTLSHSALYVKVGQIGFEQTWMDKIKENAPNLKILDSSKGITPLKDHNGIEDPHTWMSCRNARIIARNIYDEVMAQKGNSQKDRDVFRKNYQALLHDIDETDRTIRKTITPGTSFLIYHPILTYYAQEYGLTQLPMEEEGREPSARQIEELIREARKRKTRVMLIQQQFSPKNAMHMAEATGAEPIEIHPLGSEWTKEMTETAKKIK